MRLHPLSWSLPLVRARSPRRRRELWRSRDPLCFLLPLPLTWLAGPTSQPLCTSVKRYESWRPWALRLRRHPPILFYLNPNSFNLQRASNSYNSSTISPNELILFALCSLQRNLAAHQRWDFSVLPRFSGDFQKGSWYFLLVFKIIFKGWRLSWGSAEGLWTSSALRQATTTFSWCHFNICDFLTWMKWLIHAFK